MSNFPGIDVHITLQVEMTPLGGPVILGGLGPLSHSGSYMPLHWNFFWFWQVLNELLKV